MGLYGQLPMLPGSTGILWAIQASGMIHICLGGPPGGIGCMMSRMKLTYSWGEKPARKTVDLQVEHGQFKLPSLAGWTLYHGIKCSHSLQGAASTWSSKAPLSFSLCGGEAPNTKSQVLASLSCSVIIQGTNYLQSVPLDMNLHQSHVSLRSELLIESPWEC